MKHTKLKLIAAACRNMGIGNGNKLPWRLKAEMAYFTKITSLTEDAEKKNVVLMGRKTWDSIPAKYRPLADRINIIISRNMRECPEGADYLVHSLDECMSLVNSEELAAKVESVFIAGGADIYKLALESPYMHRIYLTRIDAQYDCDTFFPTFNEDDYKRITDDPNVPQDVQEEKGVQWTYQVYEKLNVV